jgi:hypothetical protein
MCFHIICISLHYREYVNVTTTQCQWRYAPKCRFAILFGVRARLIEPFNIVWPRQIERRREQQGSSLSIQKVVVDTN